MKLADRMRQSIRRRSGHVVLRAELAPLGSASQVSEALKELQRDGELLRLGAGVYAKARRDESTHEVTPVADVETLGREVAHKLKARVTDSGNGTLVLDTGDRRLSRKLALGPGSVQYVNNRSRRALTESRRKPWDMAIFPTSDVGDYVRRLASFHGVRYMPTAADQWAETVTRLAGDEVRSGPVQDLLVALKRAGKLTKDDMASLLVNYLRERKQGV
ncbi:hypothetical protein GT347_04075 [Xylophilus rhododendri]|uniref:Transcriptional regulator, AbiEi antitoxin, Type IV TA system n=1 Tax=Xylophilus rhododendri TaxID=2697032 RepID=A0A857J0V3_9BURK|nr:DUF6088 family protein [Xylophilus rhododendri]QHI97227.1 hypothetical protein GT347_04075 [Xylophilus rhododendri]